MKKLLENIMSVIALWIPMPIKDTYYFDIVIGEGIKESVLKNKWKFSFTVGKVPLGWIMVAVALIF